MSNYRPQGMKPGYKPWPDWPKEVHRNGKRAYAHNDKELEELTRPEGHPKAHHKMGGGWSLEYVPSQWPFLLYHPQQAPKAVGDPSLPDSVNEAAKAEMLKQGWQVQPVNYQNDKPQVDPKLKIQESDSRVVALEAQIGALQEMVKALVSAGASVNRNLPPIERGEERPYDPNWNPGKEEKPKAKRGRPARKAEEIPVGA